MSKDRRMRSILILVLAAAAALAAIMGHLLLSKETLLTQDKVKESASITFSWWGNDPRHQYTLDGIDLFQKKYPSIQVLPSYGVWNGYEHKNRIAMRSHNEADVMQINYSWIHEYSPDGEGYYDLRQLPGIDLSQFTAHDLDLCSVDGKLNALPIAYNMPVFFWNTDLLDHYGLEVPKTWDDLFAMAKVLQKDGIYPLSAVQKHTWLMCLARYEQVSGRASFTQDGVCRVDEPGFEDMLTFLKALFDQKVLSSMEEGSSLFANGQSAGGLAWISDLPRYTGTLADQGVRIQIGPNLTEKGGGYVGWHRKPASLIAVSKSVKHPDQAAAFVNFLLNDSDFALMQGTEKGVPVSRTAYQTLKNADAMNPIQRTATEKMIYREKEISLLFPALENEKYINIFKAAADKYLYGKEDLETCAEEMERGMIELSLGQ